MVFFQNDERAHQWWVGTISSKDKRDVVTLLIRQVDERGIVQEQEEQDASKCY